MLAPRPTLLWAWTPRCQFSGFQNCNKRTISGPLYRLKCFSSSQNLNTTEGKSNHRTISKFSQNSSSGRIHILGVGNLGRLFAHVLIKEKNSSPVSLLFHRASLIGEWEKAGRKIEISTDGVVDGQGTFDIEVVGSSHSKTEDAIENLIVATKTINTVEAISSIKHRLNSDSTILFTQNGMGTVEEVTRNLFEDASTRPNYLACVTSHGVFSQGPFRSVHAGFGTVATGKVENAHTLREPNAPPISESQYLIDKIVAAPVLAAREVPTTDLLRLQLEKLVINAMINPLTAIFNCGNGELFDKVPIFQLMRMLLQEASQVILSLPELRDDATIEKRFSTQNLETVVLDVADKTGKNISSMLQDVRAGRQTEIDYINGYLVRRGTEAGVDCRHNEKLVQMVKQGKVIEVNNVIEHFPGS